MNLQVKIKLKLHTEKWVEQNNNNKTFIIRPIKYLFNAILHPKLSQGFDNMILNQEGITVTLIISTVIEYNQNGLGGNGVSYERFHKN